MRLEGKVAIVTGSGRGIGGAMAHGCVHKPDRMITRIPAGRLGEVEDLVGPALFLATADSDYVTGTILKVDGGWMANDYV